MGTAEKNISNFLNPSKLSAYENIGERWRKQENQTQRRGKDREGFGEMRDARLKFVGSTMARKVEHLCGSKEEEPGGREGASGWNIELWTGEKLRRNGSALGNDDGGRTGGRVVGRGTGMPWVIAATICSSGRIYFYRYNLLREIKYFENKREDAIEPRDIAGHLFRAGYASKRARPPPQKYFRVCARAYILAPVRSRKFPSAVRWASR